MRTSVHDNLYVSGGIFKRLNIASVRFCVFLDPRIFIVHLRFLPLYIVVIDSDKELFSVRDVNNRYSKVTNDPQSTQTVKWYSQILNNLDNVIHVTIVSEQNKIPEKYESVVIGTGFGGTVIALSLANGYSKFSTKVTDDGSLQIQIPSFNVYPGQSQKQGIEISSNKTEPISLKINDIKFQQHGGLNFSVYDPRDPTQIIQYPYIKQPNLKPKEKLPISLKVTLDGTESEIVDLDIPVSFSLSIDESLVQLDSILHISNRHVCVLERGQWWISHEMPATKDDTTNKKSTIREFLHQHNMPYNTWAYPDNISGVLNFFGNSKTGICLMDNFQHKDTIK